MLFLNEQRKRDDKCGSVGLSERDTVLVATSEELDLIHTALTVYRTILHEKTRISRSGYSEAAIELCVRRMSVEALLDTVGEHSQKQAVRAAA